MKLGDEINDRYVLEESLGSGGMAEVFRAHDKRLERSVAIKFLAPQLAADPEFLVRFFAEAQSIAKISHPNVVSVLDFGDIEGAPFLVMQYVPGGSVADMLGDRILPERALEVVRDAALGAGAAHEAGLVHRDIKPGNILLSEEGRATVVDFGIAKSAGSEKLTATGQVVGSPHYISPEQATGQGARRQSDVYALGLVLYELLTGAPPFDGENATTIAIAHVDQKPKPPSARGADVPAAIDALVLRCLEKDPAARFTDGDELAEAIDAVLEERPVPAGVPAAGAPATTDESPVVEEAGEGRDPRKVGLAAALVLLALIVGGFVWAGAFRDQPSGGAAASGDGTTNFGPKGLEPDTEGNYDNDSGKAAAAVTPTPSGSEGLEEDGVAGRRERADRDGDSSGGPGYSPSPDSSPIPVPSESPSSEPTPAPTPSEVPEEDPPEEEPPERE